jgi:LAS superfamily LD-carboxypeptidase LdcB
MVTMTQDALGIEIPLQCADRNTYEIRTSNVIDGCTKSEISLGAGAIFTSNKTPTELNPTLLARFNAAEAAAKRDGVELKLVSGYRSLSRHPMGLAMDINYPNEPSSAKWLEVNGYKFGLCRTFKNEWWHFEGNIAPGWKCPKLLKDALGLLGR